MSDHVVSWEQSRDIIRQLGISQELEFLSTRESAVTTSWGVNWSEDFIARDLMQNFFDANRACLSEVIVAIEGRTVTISAPTPFHLERLFYLGSEKGADDIGQYGEGFKAAAMCLLRDHGVNPIALSGNQIAFLRISEQEVCDTEFRPILYDFFRIPDALSGARLILPGCSRKLRDALASGLDHFLHDHNRLLGAKRWTSWDQMFSIYDSANGVGHIFYRRLKRGEIDIPIVLVIDKQFAMIEKKVRNDRDRNAFGETVLKTFYHLFASSGIKGLVAPQSIVLEAARSWWNRGHPLLSELAGVASLGWNRGSCWAPADTARVFGDGYYALSVSKDTTDQLQFDRLERAWKAEGRQALPGYFREFGVANGHHHVAAMMQRARDEEKRLHQRIPSSCETRSIHVLQETLRELAPEISAIFDKGGTEYSIAGTDTLLGVLRRERSYRSRQVFLSAGVLDSDFGRALAVFLHEHAHVFGHDGSRGFTDALTELLETVVRSRAALGRYERRWEAARAAVIRERHGQRDGQDRTMAERLAILSEKELRELLCRIPAVVIRPLLESEQSEED